MRDTVREYRRRTVQSGKLFQRAKKVMPGGVCHNIRYFPPYPFYIKKAKGSRIWDVDGNEYIDLWMAHYEAILGHSPEIIVNELSGILSKGTHWGLVNEYQVELAELICQVVPSAEKVRFCCSGTEATMYAVRLARAFTGKNVILKVAGGWHGANTDLSVAIHSPYEQRESAGLLPEISQYIKFIHFNDIEGSLKIMRQNTDNLAAVLIEPVPGQGCLPAEPGYLKALREETRKLEAVLIFDEVIDGFRLCLGGAQEKYGIIPDLTTLGKILGGGMPIGAVVGKEDILDLFDPTKVNDKWVLAGGGSFSANPLSMAAGIRMITYLKENARIIYPRLDRNGERIRREIEKVFNESGVLARCTGDGSLFGLQFPFKEGVKLRNPRDIEELTDLERRDKELRLRMLNHGVHVWKGGGALSTAHSDEDIQTIIEAYYQVAKEMAKE